MRRWGIILLAALLLAVGVHNIGFAAEVEIPVGGCAEVVTSGSVHGTLAAGETHCRVVSGSGTVLLARPWRQGTQAAVRILDDDGASLCSGNLCTLSGPAQYRVFVRSEAGADYRFALQRIKPAAGCRALPLDPIGTAARTTATFTSSDFFTCFTLPATPTARKEIISFARTAGPTRGAVVSVRDDAGRIVCGRAEEANQAYLASWNFRCSFDANKAYSLSVVADIADGSFRFARRDAGPTTAKCIAATPATIGAKAIAGTLGTVDEVRCYRFPATAATNYWANARGATEWVTSAAGTLLCTTGPCRLTGSTSYQVVLAASTARPFQFDVWSLGDGRTAPAACPALPTGAPGFGPISGALGDDRSAVCAAYPAEQNNSFDVKLTNTAGGEALPEVYLFPVEGPSGSVPACPISSGAGCSYHRDNTYPPVLLVISGSDPFKMETGCTPWPSCYPDDFAITGADTAVAGNHAPLTTTLRGTAFDLADQVVLSRTGSSPIKATVTRLSNDRTALAIRADLTNVTPGAWTVTATSALKNTQAVLPGGLTVQSIPMSVARGASISGPVRVGATVKAVPPTTQPTATAYAYQWLANGTAITGAASSSYVIPASLRTKKLAVRVTAKRTNRPDAVLTSAASTVNSGAAPVATKRAAVSGTARTGSTVKAAVGTWAPAATSYAYIWTLNGKAIAGATKSTFKIPASYAGKKLAVIVVAKRTGHLDGRSTSPAVTVKK